MGQCWAGSTQSSSTSHGWAHSLKSTPTVAHLVPVGQSESTSQERTHIEAKQKSTSPQGSPPSSRSHGFEHTLPFVSRNDALSRQDRSRSQSDEFSHDSPSSPLHAVARERRRSSADARMIGHYRAALALARRYPKRGRSRRAQRPSLPPCLRLQRCRCPSRNRARPFAPTDAVTVLAPRASSSSTTKSSRRGGCAGSPDVLSAAGEPVLKTHPRPTSMPDARR